MLFSVGIFFLSAIFVNLGMEELARSRGFAGDSGVFGGIALAAFVLLLLADEFAIGAALHFRVARERGRRLGKWLGGASVGIGALLGLAALASFGFAVLAAATGG